VKKAVGLLLVAVMLTGIFGGAGAALAAPDTAGPPGGGPAAVMEQPLPGDGPGFAANGGKLQERRAGIKAFRERMAGKFKKLKELRQETRRLLGELKERRDTLKPLIAEARENGEKEKLAKLEPIRIDAKAIVEATRKLRAEKRQLWHEFFQAVRNGEWQRAEAIFDQILWHKQVINANLKQLIALADKAIAILQQ